MLYATNFHLSGWARARPSNCCQSADEMHGWPVRGTAKVDECGTRRTERGCRGMPNQSRWQPCAGPDVDRRGKRWVGVVRPAEVGKTCRSRCNADSARISQKHCRIWHISKTNRKELVCGCVMCMYACALPSVYLCEPGRGYRPPVRTSNLINPETKSTEWNYRNIPFGCCGGWLALLVVLVNNILYCVVDICTYIFNTKVWFWNWNQIRFNSVTPAHCVGWLVYFCAPVPFRWCLSPAEVLYTYR